MTRKKRQGFWAPTTATLRFPRSMRLARDEQERLWKGLERFANCKDSEIDYRALGRAFPACWPIGVYKDFTEETLGADVSAPQSTVDSNQTLSDEQLREIIEGHPGETGQDKQEVESHELDWQPACYRLFHFYHDALRAVWKGKKGADWDRPEFLLGLTDLNERAINIARKHSDPVPLYDPPFELCRSWAEILEHFPTAIVGRPVQINLLWGYGDFKLALENDFQKAFYLLFRQSWRARVCPRCKMLFVGRRSKQRFCGTACSAGSRLESKRKWWCKVGAKRRAGIQKRGSNGINGKNIRSGPKNPP